MKARTGTPMWTARLEMWYCAVDKFGEVEACLANDLV